MTKFSIVTEALKNCDLVHAEGRLDSESAPRLAEALKVLTDADHYKLVLDMSKLEFVSSAGLRVLIETQKVCKQLNRGELVLAAVPARVVEALDMAGFIPLFTLADDVLHAVGNI